MDTVQIFIEPRGLLLKAGAGSTLLDALRAAGIELDAPCGGAGTCGKCKVIITENPPPPTWADEEALSDAEVAGGVRLACRVKLARDLKVRLFESHERGLQKAPTFESPRKFNPLLQSAILELPKPSLTDQRSDSERVFDTVSQATGGSCNPALTPLSLLGRFPSILREAGWRVEALFDDVFLLGLRPAGEKLPPLYGIALDIGTTTLAAYAVDMRTGQRLGTAARINPQRSFGGDVVSRIEAISSGSTQSATLQERVMEGLNSLILEACQGCGACMEEVYHVTVVGNPTMTHLFLGLDPRNMAAAPYITVQGDTYCVRAKELGLSVNPEARVFVLPSVSAYVGADTVGVILATGMDLSDKTTLAIDIGTNGEMALAHKGRLYSCSTAAGPAFEGANISQGMRAEAGAISEVHINHDVAMKTIGMQPARGICGSGLLDAVAELVKSGLVASSGRMMGPEDALADGLPEALSTRVEAAEGGNRFRLTPETATDQVWLTQRDVRELQLAKSAIRAGMETLLSKAGIGYEEIEALYLAGAFGNYLDKYSAAAVGMVPGALLERIISVGNAAGSGAELALTDREAWGRITRIKNEMVYVELSANLEFQELYVDHMMFPD